MKEGKYATKLKRNRLLKNNNHVEIGRMKVKSDVI